MAMKSFLTPTHSARKRVTNEAVIGKGGASTALQYAMYASSCCVYRLPLG